MSQIHQYPLFEHWYKTNLYILERCEKMPKNTRYSISNPIMEWSTGICALLVEAIYSKEKLAFLLEINKNLEKLRIFFRICKDKAYITVQQYVYVSEQIDEAGKMCGGWIKKL